MSAITVADVWVEYGDQIVLERINLEIASGAFVSMVGPSRLRQDHLPAHAARPGAADPRQHHCSTASRCRREPGPDRGIVFQRYSVFPHLTVLGNVLLGFEFAQSPIAGAAVRRGAARGDRKKRSAARRGRPRRASRQVSERAVRRHAAAPGDRAGADARSRASCCSTSRSARSIPARARDARADPAALARARHDHLHGHARHQGGVRARHAPARLRPAPRATRRRPDASAPRSPTIST